MKPVLMRSNVLNVVIFEQLDENRGSIPLLAMMDWISFRAVSSFGPDSQHATNDMTDPFVQ